MSPRLPEADLRQASRARCRAVPLRARRDEAAHLGHARRLGLRQRRSTQAALQAIAPARRKYAPSGLRRRRNHTWDDRRDWEPREGCKGRSRDNGKHGDKSAGNPDGLRARARCAPTLRRNWSQTFRRACRAWPSWCAPCGPDRGLSTRGLARRSAVARSTVQRIERGVMHPRRSLLSALALGLDVDRQQELLEELTAAAGAEVAPESDGWRHYRRRAARARDPGGRGTTADQAAACARPAPCRGCSLAAGRGNH